MSNIKTRKYFGSYDEYEIELSSGEYDITVSFFESMGFESSVAVIVASSVLVQAKKENINAQQLVEKFKKTDRNHLDQIVNTIMNKNTGKTSVVGFRKKTPDNLFENRNIVL